MVVVRGMDNASVKQGHQYQSIRVSGHRDENGVVSNALGSRQSAAEAELMPGVKGKRKRAWVVFWSEEGRVGMSDYPILHTLAHAEHNRL